MQHLCGDLKGRSENSDRADNLLQELDLPNGYPDGPGNDQEAWQSILVDLLDSQEMMTPSEVNRKRKLLTFKAFQDGQIIDKTVAMQALVSPNVDKLFQLFGRSSAVATLQRLPDDASEERANLVEKCLSFWQSFFSLV